jgi:hypothetical protein
MAQKLDWFSQWWRGEWADRRAINANADALEDVEATVGGMQRRIDRQAKEILRQRAMITGMIELLYAANVFDERALQRSVNAAWTRLTAPPALAPAPSPSRAQPVATDPYRGLPASEPVVTDDPDAKALLQVAEEHVFFRRFSDARAVYTDVIARYPDTQQAAVAREHLADLGGA